MVRVGLPAERELWLSIYWKCLSVCTSFKYGFICLLDKLLSDPPLFNIYAEVVDKMQNFFNRHGNLSQVWMGTQLYVLVNDPIDVEMILNSPSCLDKGASYYFINQFFGRGLVTLERIFNLFFLNYLLIVPVIKRFRMEGSPKTDQPFVQLYHYQ